jgi:hypothetical protein
MSSANGRLIRANSDGSFLAPLSSTEAGMFTISHERHGALRVGIVARFFGRPFSDKALKSAIKAIQRRHPFMTATVNEDMEFHIDYNLKINPSRIQRKSPDSWQDAWEGVMNGPIQYHAPLVHFAIIANGDQEQEFEIFVAAEHFVCDGTCLSHLLHGFLCILTKTPLPNTDEPLPAPAPIESLTSTLPWKWNFWSILLAFLIALIVPVIKFFAWCSKPIKTQSGPHRRWAVRTLNADETPRLQKAARNKGTTIAGVLMATVTITLAFCAISKSLFSIVFVSPLSILKSLGSGGDKSSAKGQAGIIRDLPLPD